MGRVMVDPEAFNTHNGHSSLGSPHVSARYSMKPEGLTEDQLLICAYWINGYSFVQKVWAQLAVNALSDIVWNDEAFQKLVIKESRRRLIHDLVKAHRQDEAAFDDIV